MVFSSLPFLFIFLPISFLLYFIVPRAYKNGILFFASLIFYAWGEPVYIVIMLFSTVVDYTHGLMVAHFKAKGQMGKAKGVVASSMIINLALLAFFKYSDFVIGNVNGIFDLAIPLLNIPLPIGISFYTFQTMSYTVDVYRGQAQSQKNIISFGAYVALFPQLIAGPIVQYKTIADQLDNRRETVDQFATGVSRFMMGLGKKVLLANSIGYLWSQISGMDIGTLPVLMAWLGIVAFSFQIYFDFSAYSDMAIGLGNMLGFKFLENFDYPYMSKSITEFWRRWHISLGTWFREYVYIPLGGNRCGVPRQVFNILVVWLATGIWHGASWNFVVWGLYFGVLLLIEKLFLAKYLQKAPVFVQRIYTLMLVLFSWVIFALEDFATVLAYFKAMFGLNGAPIITAETGYLFYTNLLLIILLVLGSTGYPKIWVSKLFARMKARPIAVSIIQNVAFVSVFVLSVAYLVDASFNPFLYFRF